MVKNTCYLSGGHRFKTGGGRVAHMTCCGKARRVGDPTGTSWPLLSHKFLVYLASRLLDIPLGGCCSHGLKKQRINVMHIFVFFEMRKLLGKDFNLHGYESIQFR